MGRIERPPNWILKYKDRIDSGKVTVEGILEEENQLRAEPIKISSVTRAINALGHPITGLRRRKKGETEEGEAKKTLEAGGEPERIERGPEWLQKYRERIESGAITIDKILEEESKIRAEPIKIATVKRAVNAMGYPITRLQEGKKEEKEEAKESIETGGKSERKEKGPGWLQKYRERIGQGTITVDEILEEENKIREVPIKRSSVTRAVNAMGYPLTEMRSEEREEAGEVKATVYSSNIGKISEATAKRFNAMKKSWEEDLSKSLDTDYFVNILLALAKLAEHGKSLVPVKR